MEKTSLYSEPLRYAESEIINRTELLEILENRPEIGEARNLSAVRRVGQRLSALKLQASPR